MKFLKKGVISTVIAACIFTLGTSMYNTSEVFAAVNERSITVTGNSSVTFQPNIANVSIGVVTVNEDLNIAQSENNSKTDELIQKLNQSGIAMSDITTSHYFVSPNYFSFDTPDITTYRVENYLEVTIRNLDDIGEILNIAVENGANSLGGITFSNTNTDEYYTRALQNAILDATQKANVVANTIGYELGSIANVVEGNSFNHFPISRGDVFLSSNSAIESVPIITPNELSVNANVVITFLY